uniref:TNF alpha induced protein 2 n=1 Tax=Amazona collaria TaxID=241587 RepID=A0A8B9FHT2_9PSIT
MKEDLIVVVKYIKQLYPPEFNVFSIYAELYHNYFASQTKKSAESHLEDKDVYLLLSWVHNFYPKKDHILAEELEKVKLGSLLPSSLSKELENKYLEREEATIKNLLSRCLDKEIQRWKEEEEPEKFNGHFQSELLGIFVIQVIQIYIRNKQFHPAWHALICLSPSHLPCSYKDAFEDFKEKSKKHRYYKPILIASVNNCWNFRYSREAYIVRLLKRKVSLKGTAQQQNLAQHISKNAADLEAFCTSNGSQATWLNSALPKLAEIIRLQDLGAIKIEVATLATTYPDIRKRHLEAFLYIKANLSRSELKSILGYLADSTASLVPKAPLFSDINVS